MWKGESLIRVSLGEIHLGTADRYAAFIHNAFWLDDRFAIAGTMQFGPTSLTPAKASIIGPSIWLVDTRTMKATKIIGTAKGVDDSGVLRSASWITVAGDKLLGPHDIGYKAIVGIRRIE